MENWLNAGARAVPFQYTRRRGAFSLHSASGRQPPSSVRVARRNILSRYEDLSLHPGDTAVPLENVSKHQQTVARYRCDGGGEKRNTKKIGDGTAVVGGEGETTGRNADRISGRERARGRNFSRAPLTRSRAVRAIDQLRTGNSICTLLDWGINDECYRNGERKADACAPLRAGLTVMLDSCTRTVS